MKRSKNLVKLSNQTYDNIVENTLNDHSNNLNRVMKGLAAMTVLVLPFNIVSAFFGMNVKVPFQDEETMLPFFMLFTGSIICASILYFILKGVKWL